MRLASTLAVISVALSLLVTGAETAFAETPGTDSSAGTPGTVAPSSSLAPGSSSASGSGRAGSATPAQTASPATPAGAVNQVKPADVASTPSSPSAPASSTPSAPASSTPSAPASSTPSGPASSTPSAPASSTATAQPTATATAAPTATATINGRAYRPYCDNLANLVDITASPASQTLNGITNQYLGTSVFVGQAPDLVGWTPKQGALFNNPNSAKDSVALLRQMLNGLRAAKAGETVKIAMYSTSRWDAAKAVIRASCRGVNIQYLTDDHAVTNSATVAIKTVLAAQNSGSAFYACYLSCSSDYIWHEARLRVVTTDNPTYRPYMHAKYLTFDNLAGKRYVSMVSSGNFTSTQIKNGWNNMYTAVDDKSTFDFLNSRLAEMWTDTSGNDYATNVSTSPVWLKTFFFPWAVADPDSAAETVNPATDPFTSFLENIKCTGMAKGYGNGSRHTQVLVSMYQWTSSRLYLARRLKTLKDRGCEVKVLMSSSEWDLEVMPILRKWDASKVKTTYKFGNIPIRDGDVKGNFIHSKFIIVNGRYGSNRKAKMVFTGSGNWTKAALRFNNELSILISSHQAYNQYKANWNKLWGSKKYSVPITKLVALKPGRTDA